MRWRVKPPFHPSRRCTAVAASPPSIHDPPLPSLSHVFPRLHLSMAALRDESATIDLDRGQQRPNTRQALGRNWAQEWSREPGCSPKPRPPSTAG